MRLGTVWYKVMRNPMISIRKPMHLVAWALLGMAMFGQTGVANAQSRPNDGDLAKGLKAGGYVIVMRHAKSDPDKADTDPLNFKSAKNQQPLTEQGRTSAKAFGNTLRAIGVQFSEVLTSRYQRAYETAVLAGFKTAKPVVEVTEGSLVASPNENKRRATELRKLVATAPPLNQNRLIVTHKANIVGAFGKEWFEVKEGEASIFKVENGAYNLVARLQMEDWSRLAQAVAVKAP
jgi:phosphohistidine phosphatase SixA